MYQTTMFSLFLSSTVLLLAGGPSWQNKPSTQWNENDAKQVLRNSPWVKRATVSLLYQPNESQLRSGGKMGGGNGVYAWPDAAAGAGRDGFDEPG